jgi:hypothetical protein
VLAQSAALRTVVACDFSILGIGLEQILLFVCDEMRYPYSSL